VFNKHIQPGILLILYTLSILSTLPEAEIARRLAAAPIRGEHNPFPPGFFKEAPRLAAILIPFTCVDGAWHLLFIRRTQHENDRHGGQVAFPGGRVETSDPDIASAALREAEEEVGLKPSDVHILGRMNDYLSVTNYLVTPFVGVFPWPYPIKTDPREVSRAFTIPLKWLANADNAQVMHRHLPQSRPWPVIYFDPYDGEALWGFTGQVVVQLLEILRIQK
jgi:8-oxo-dGTP pyrophosphatase MutT (NUDIX family)